jgi:methionyl-tRNA synthetase
VITFQDFQRMQMVVGRIASVADHPNADKLYVMQIDIGGETRQSVAGLKPYYRPEDLVGRLVAVVTNLQPAALRGVESQAMLLAAVEGSKVVFLTPEKEIGVGAVIR